jgi:hypothetical protein
MELEFVDRAADVENVKRLIWVKPSRPRVITLDSPAGMGKTRLLFEVCRDLVREAYRREVEWRIVRLDFRQHFPEQYGNEKDVIEEIARQLCRDTMWDNICKLIQEADPDDQVFIQQAAFIPMEDEVRQALLDMAAGIPSDVRAKINHIIAGAFQNADIQEAGQRGDLLSVPGLVGFTLDTCHRIPGHVLLIIDSVDAITDERLRRWVVNNLALGLGVNVGLQNAFRRFAVIVSGRFVEHDLDPLRKEQDFQEIPLPSFADKSFYVADLIRRFDDAVFNAQNDLVSTLARKLCQTCGGHPKVIKDTAAELYACPGHFAALDTDPQGIDYWYDQDRFKGVLRQYRDKAISEILEGIEEQERCLLGLLSVFRRFNPATLEFLSDKIQENQLHEYAKCFRGDIKELYKNLRETRLIGNDEAKDPFDSDRFSLNLLSAQIRDKDPDLFRLLNEWAVALFADWIKGKFSDDPDAALQPNLVYQQIGVCEWLFHRLHLADCCSKLSDADKLGEEISDELKEILKDILPYPFESQAQQRRRIQEIVENDEKIDHVTWEIALEGKTRHDTIRSKILQAFVTAQADKHEIHSQADENEIHSEEGGVR